MRRTVIFCLLLALISLPSLGQKKDSVKALITTRYMQTFNEGSLKDFHVMVTHGNIYYGRKLTPWLNFGIQFNGLVHYGADNISTPDPSTGIGPIYEGNLWNTRLFSGGYDMVFTQLNLNAKFGNHQFSLGQFLKNTPLINIEPWPYPNGIEGFWYEQKGRGNWDMQFGFITRISPRQSGVFTDIGKTIGQGGVGWDIFDTSSQYRGNVRSGYIIVANSKYRMNAHWTIDAWNYYADNLFNVFMLEPRWKSADKGLEIKTLMMYQTRVGDGGNENPRLTFMNGGDFANAYYLGFRMEKQVGKGMLQLNFSRIADQGRFLLPKEWGLEPFYAFQRRTRIEGAANVTGLMLKYQRVWEGERGKFRLFATGGYTNMPDHTDLPRNKFGVPSFSHWAISPKYDFKQGSFKKFSFELYMAYRFRTVTVDNPVHIINRNALFHIDLILSWQL